MTQKNAILELLTRDDLKSLVARFDLNDVDRRSVDAMRTALASARAVKSEELVASLPRDTILRVCEALQLPTKGKKDNLIQAILASGSGGTAKKRSDAKGSANGSPNSHLHPSVDEVAEVVAEKRDSRWRGQKRQKEATGELNDGISNGHEKIDQDDINAVLWKACDTFRGTIDPSEYKNYILVMLFLKYISDVWRDRYAQLSEQFQADDRRIRRQLQFERFVLPEASDYYTLLKQREEDNLGELINEALAAIEDANKQKLSGVFRNIDFNSEAALGRTKQRNERLKHLLDDFNDARMDLRPSRIGHLDIIGNAYEYLIARFASGAGKKAGEFYTPPEVSLLLAELLDPKPGDRICDPACGSGSLLIKCAQRVQGSNYALYGQEANGATWALCMMNMFLHDINVTTANIKWTDTLREPRLTIDSDRLMRFNVVVANPPFSLDKWGAETAGADRFRRFHRGVPPKSKADYAFVSHMIETTFTEPSQHGRVGVVVPHGVLFRAGAEGVIRQKLVEENMLDAVIGLPENLFYGTGIPAAILIFRRDRTDDRVLFIDASRDYEEGTNKNVLRGEDRTKIATAYKRRETVTKYSYLATRKKIEENAFNLNIPRYVDVFDEEVPVDLVKVNREISETRKRLRELEGKMGAYLKELGLNG